MDVAIALIAAVVAILGWNVSHWLTVRRDDRTRRIEFRIMRLERQLEELYGPLDNLIIQIFNVWNVKTKLIAGLSDAERSSVQEFVWLEYFLPLHYEIRDLLKAKSHLAEGVPRSFRDYMEHSTQELFQHRLNAEKGLVLQNIARKQWPQAFHSDVTRAIDSIIEERRALLRDLAPAGTWRFQKDRAKDFTQ